MLRLAVIGDPIAHSISPEIHRAVLGRLGVDCEYTAVNVRRNELKSWIKRSVGKGINGFNVTMPHKVDIIQHLYEIDDEAARYGAVNTVVARDGRLYGYNTDGRGFLMSLQRCGVKTQGKKIVIAGTGGTATTIAGVCLAGGAESVIALGRNDLYDLPSLAREADILVNATPLGMHGNNEWEDISFIDTLREDAAVCDVIYNPLRTKLLDKAEKRSLVAINGLGMLVCQAVLADEYFLE